MSGSSRKFRMRAWAGAIGLLAVAVTAMAVYGGSANLIHTAAWYAPASQAAPAETPSAGEAVGYAKSMSKAFHDAASRLLPSVVMITNRPQVAQISGNNSPDADSDNMPFGSKGTPFGGPEFREFFKQFREMPHTSPHGVMGAGSGVIVDPSGIILTNNHVVAGGGQVMVRLHDGREFKAVDIKTDPKSDLALVRIEGAGTLPAARLGDSDKVEVGDWVLALGQPFGLEGTVTAGIVSAKGRGLGITDREDFIQTDAAINPGNSGGPLVDLDGQVIGINTAISTNSGGYQGVGFAIPANLAKWVGGQLEQGGAVHRAFLGVAIQPITQPLAEQFKVKMHDGVLVTDVRPDTPAAKAGLKAGDVLLRFAGQTVTGPRELQNMVERCAIGSTQSLSVLRDGKPITLSVTCREMPADFTAANFGGRESADGTSRFDQLGIEAETLTPKLAEHLGVKADHGVAITDVHSGSPAAAAGLATGMVITEVNRMPVKTTEDLEKALKAKSLDQGVLLLVRSAEGSRFVVIRVESK